MERMHGRDADNFWYAVNNTEIVLMPSRQLETFGSTVFNYYMVSELMDSIDQVRVREGQVKAERPKVITPASYAKLLLDGFGDEARQFIEWIRTNRKDLRILQYGFAIRKEEITEQVYRDHLKTVVDRVRRYVTQKNDPLSAVVVGVDNPWEVCILKLLVEIIGESMPTNVGDLDRRQMFSDTGGVPRAVRREIEAAFTAARKDASRVKELGRLLQSHDVFEEYEDRFFALIRSRQK